MNSEILIVLLITAVACSIIGVFLVLRNLAMVSDAISHSVLLGIIIAYFITKDVTSPFLIIGAGMFGVITVFFIDMLLKSRLIKEDSATGIIYSLFFAIAVIIISKYARNVHIDIDTVFMGEIIYAPLNTITIFGMEVSKSLFYMSIMLFINLLFILIFYKELKISSFDPCQAMLSGFSISVIYYGLMILVSTTAVAAFDVVGAILVISYLIVPGASAYLISNKLRNVLILSVVYAVFNSIIGYYLALIFNVNISGMCALVTGITFMITLLFNRDGMVFRVIRKNQQKKEYRKQLILIHIENHGEDAVENGKDTMAKHLSWKDAKLKNYLNNLQKEGYIVLKNNVYLITEKGISKNKKIKEEYNI